LAPAFLLLQDEVTFKNITINVSMKAPGADFRGAENPNILLGFIKRAI
jgi:hypothetical protein